MRKGRVLLGLPLVLWGIPLLYPALQTGSTAHDVARVCQLVIIAAAAIGLLLSTPNRPAQVSLRNVVRWSAIVLLVTVSSLLAAHPVVAVHEVVMWAGLLGLMALLSQGLRSADEICIFLRFVVVGTAAHAILVLLILALAIAGGGNVYPWEALVGFDNPRFLNHAQTVVLPLVAAVATHDARPLWRRWAVVTLVLSGMILFITLGRATILALLLGLLTALVCFRGNAAAYARRSAGFTLLGMGLMWLVYLHWLQPAGHSIDVQGLSSAHFRDYLLACAFKLWQTSPWVGVGPMHFSHWYNGEAAHPHNIYAQVLAEYGAIGAVLILGPALQWMGRMLGSLRAAIPAHAGIAIGLMVALVGVAVDGAFSGNFVMPVSQLWIAVLIGLCMATARIFAQGVAITSARPPLLASPWTRARVLPTFLIFALKATLAIAISVMAIKALVTCAVTSSPQFDTSGPVAGRPDVDNTNPRFWTHGWF
ncbi:O-antigen ligase family protein [Roseateles depolymerans]|uniref:O-antigen ligase-related domain-containing protein n=1 Tax=Roseateles depolymerans TaxID=76731 RepID=A0A0U3MK74_9BURK|nr:O-antigen ligase family protein [Roseateles depolymerans]ALV09133.1 hypothetical protein RD2015_4693 [Roseateles depolymerans]REG13888.1 O-antigen ligase [Roseateles depolymerans]